jgi:hypothetical protein
MEHFSLQRDEQLKCEKLWAAICYQRNTFLRLYTFKTLDQIFFTQILWNMLHCISQKGINLWLNKCLLQHDNISLHTALLAKKFSAKRNIDYTSVKNSTLLAWLSPWYVFILLRSLKLNNLGTFKTLTMWLQSWIRPPEKRFSAHRWVLKLLLRRLWRRLTSRMLHLVAWQKLDEVSEKLTPSIISVMLSGDGGSNIWYICLFLTDCMTPHPSRLSSSAWNGSDVGMHVKTQKVSIVEVTILTVNDYIFLEDLTQFSVNVNYVSEWGTI